MLEIARLAMLHWNQMGSSGRRRWCTVIVLVAVCALTVSVATRYTSSPGATDKALAVEKQQAWSPGLQRLLNNAATWIPPFVDTAIFRDPGSHLHVVRSGPAIPTVLLERNLYNRPPPAPVYFS